MSLNYEKARKYVFYVAPVAVGLPLIILSYAYTAVFEPSSTSALALISIGTANVGFVLGNVVNDLLISQFKMKVVPHNAVIVRMVVDPNIVLESQTNQEIGATPVSLAVRDTATNLDPTPTPSAITVNIRQ